jgi:hypothetical protein
MRTAEDSANPIGELISAKQTLGLYNLALAVSPFGFDGVQPQTLLWQQAAYDSHSFVALFDLWDSPASTDTLTLRDVGFSYSILLEVDGTPVA